MRLSLVRLCGGKRLLGVSEFGVGTGLERFQLAPANYDLIALLQKALR